MLFWGRVGFCITLHLSWPRPWWGPDSYGWPSMSHWPRSLPPLLLEQNRPPSSKLHGVTRAQQHASAAVWIWSYPGQEQSSDVQRAASDTQEGQAQAGFMHSSVGQASVAGSRKITADYQLTNNRGQDTYRTCNWVHIYFAKWLLARLYTLNNWTCFPLAWKTFPLVIVIFYIV